MAQLKVYREDFKGSFSVQIRSYVEDDTLWATWTADGDSDMFLFADIKVDETMKSIEILSTYRYGYGAALKPEFEESYNFIDQTDIDILQKMYPDYAIIMPYFGEPEYDRWSPYAVDIFNAPSDSYSKAIALFECVTA